jgi:hypothetical protein
MRLGHERAVLRQRLFGAEELGVHHLRKPASGKAATSVLKQWMICGWLSRKATSKVPAAGGLTVEPYTPAPPRAGCGR